MIGLRIRLLDGDLDADALMGAAGELSDPHAVKALRTPGGVLACAVAYAEDRPFGIALAHRVEQPPGVAFASVHVEPGRRERGVGTALGRLLLDHLDFNTPSVVEAHLSDGTFVAPWAGWFGFRPHARRVTSDLDLTGLDLAVDPAPPGLRLRSLRVLLDQHPRADETWRHLHELLASVASDIPDEDARQLSPEDVVGFGQGDVLLDPRTTIVATHEDRWIGLCLARRVSDDPLARHVGMTGVLPEWRRKGVARVLKQVMHHSAHRDGVRRVSTDNDALNRAMLALNDAFGYRPLRTSVRWRRPRPTPHGP